MVVFLIFSTYVIGWEFCTSYVNDLIELFVSVSLPTSHEKEDVLSFMLRQLKNLPFTEKQIRDVVSSGKTFETESVVLFLN